MAGLKADAATRIDSASGLIQGLPRWTATTTCSRAVWTVTALLEEKATPRKRSTVYTFFIDFSNDEWHQLSTSLSLSTTLITSLTLLNVMDAIWIAGAKILPWVMILPRGSRERVSLLNCVLFPSSEEFFSLFFFNEFRYKKLTTILKFFILKLRKENSVYHGMVNPRGGGGNKNTEG